MSLSPKEIVQELDKYIIGQNKAKKAVAIALRNRYRRSQLSDELKEEICPKNIIMKGPTGVGKTEIARRLAKIVGAPFVKVEATKFTEVGYVGRDVESMVRDLVEVSIRLVKEQKRVEVQEKAKQIAEERLVQGLIQLKQKQKQDNNELEEVDEKKIKEDYYSGKLDDSIIFVNTIEQNKALNMNSQNNEMDFIAGVMKGFIPQKQVKKSMKVKEARNLFINEQCEKMIDNESLYETAIKLAEEQGIIFIDEIDKISSKGSANGPDVSREGVQRDILPIVEGCTVGTKYGNIKTDYILFIAAGAFHISKMEDLIPELQGRFPVRVELENLSKNDFVKILTEPKNAVIKQYKEILKVDKVDLTFTDDAIDEIADIAFKENETSENIGARRLQTVMEALLEDISYNANGENDIINVEINKLYVQNALSNIKKKYDLKKYVI